MATATYPPQSGKKLTYGTSSEPGRYETVENLILAIHQAANLPTPTSSTLELKVKAWLEVLAPVPTEHLHASYRQALDAHDGQFAITAYEVLTGWQAVKAELLRYPAQPEPVAGYLPDGQPVEYYNLGPAIAELKRWALKLGWPADVDEPGRLVRRADGLLIRYALNVKLRHNYSVPDLVEWIGMIGESVFECKGDFDELLNEMHAKEDQPIMAPFTPDPCPICHGMGHYLITDRKAAHVNTNPLRQQCGNCGGRG